MFIESPVSVQTELHYRYHLRFLTLLSVASYRWDFLAQLESFSLNPVVVQLQSLDIPISREVDCLSQPAQSGPGVFSRVPVYASMFSEKSSAIFHIKRQLGHFQNGIVVSARHSGTRNPLGMQTNKQFRSNLTALKMSLSAALNEPLVEFHARFEGKAKK